jgi:hypothetical protein
MSYPMEPVLARKPLAVLRHRLRVEFGPPTDWEIERGYVGPDAGDARGGPVDRAEPGEVPPSHYRAEVTAHILRLFGCPTPEGLTALIDEAGELGAPAEAVARFIGRQFRLKLLRRYANRCD